MEGVCYIPKTVYSIRGSIDAQIGATHYCLVDISAVHCIKSVGQVDECNANRSILLIEIALPLLS